METRGVKLGKVRGVEVREMREVEVKEVRLELGKRKYVK